MNTLRVRPALRVAVNQAARRCVNGASPIFEVGYRDDGRKPGGDTENGRFWPPDDNDLIRMEEWRKVHFLEFDVNDRCSLDLYAYTGHKDQRTLETNVTVWIVKEGDQARVVGAWEFDNSPEFNRTDDEVESSWQRLQYQGETSTLQASA